MKSNFIKLNDNRYLYNDCGKYRSNLTFILNNVPVSKGEWNKGEEGFEYLEWGQTHANEFNLEGRMMKSLVGDFWVSPKGTNCFAPNPKGKFILVCEDWGGSRDRGDLSSLESMVYFRRASSNGGGTGYTYAIFPLGWKQELSINDI